MADPADALRLIFEHFSAIPMWPQLPRRSFLENMYTQFSEGFPGVILEDDRIAVDRDAAAEGLEPLYAAYLDERTGGMGISADYAEGLAAFLSTGDRVREAVAVKGQVTGPVSMGLQIADTDRRPILYDDVLADALAKHLRLKARWQEQALAALYPRTVVFVDEPYLSTFGSAYVPIQRDQVVGYLEEVFGGLDGLKGVHCCGNTDWSMLLSTSADIVSFDAYDYAVPFSLYAPDVKAFLRRGGSIAWGVVPTDAALLAKETAESLTRRLLDAMELLVGKGIPRDELVAAGLVTPACGLGPLPVDAAARACALTAAVSREMRRLIA